MDAMELVGWPLLRGFGWGIAFSFMLGTVFFSLLHNSISYGYRTGFMMVAGVVCSDLLLILAALLLGIQTQTFIQHWQQEITVVGAIILIGFGIFMWFKPVKEPTNTSLTMGTFLKYFSHGFLLNIVNPVNFIMWLSFSTNNLGTLGYKIWQNNLFFLSCIGGIALSEMGIAYYAQQIRRFLTAKVLKRINQVLAVIFVIAAIRMLWPIIGMA